MLLEGIFLPLTTPFYPDGSLNLRKLEHNVDRYSRTPAAGLVVLGSTGEASLLTETETRQALETAMAFAAKDKVMLAGVGRDSVFATLVIATLAAAHGYDAGLVSAPSTELTELELKTYFQAVADQSPLPVVLVSDERRELPVELIGKLAGHPSVIGLVDDAASGERLKSILAATSGISREVTVTTVFAAATGRMLKVEDAGPGAFVSAESLGGGVALAVAPPKPALKTRVKRVGFQVLAGSTAGMLDALEHGAVGAVPRFGACAPQACCEVFQAWKDDDLPLAAEKQERIAKVAARTEGPGSIAAIKFGCDLNGYYGGRPRLPLLGLTGDARAEMEWEMAGIRN